MARPRFRDPHVLMAKAQSVLRITQAELGALAGSSKRTAQRWAAGQAPVYEWHLAKLAGHVHPHDAALAAEIAAAAGETLESLGIVEPPPPPPPAPPPGPPPPPPMPRHLAADAVVCVAAEGMGLAPGAVRGALVAAFRRARELGLSLAEVEQALGAGDAGGKKARGSP